MADNFANAGVHNSNLLWLVHAVDHGANAHAGSQGGLLQSICRPS